MKKLGILVTGAALAAYSITAQAAIRVNATRANNFISTAVSVPLPLNNAGATVRSFNLPSNKKLLLTYSAECSAGGTNGWVDIDVVVNGVVVAPTVGSNDVFCSVNHTEITGDGWTRASITVQIQGIAGNNNVQIIGRRDSGATSMWFGDSALIVFD